MAPAEPLTFVSSEAGEQEQQTRISAAQLRCVVLFAMKFVLKMGYQGLMGSDLSNDPQKDHGYP